MNVASRLLRNPFAGRYVETIEPFMEALKPLGLDDKARSEYASFLDYAAQQSGSSLEGLTTGISRLQKNLSEVAKGGGKAAAQALEALGLSAQELSRQDIVSQLTQVGTALLLCDEAGTSEVHRRALRDDRLTDTVVTRAFSGRYARSLVNAFTDRYSAVAPPGYPQLNQMTAPIRAAAGAAGDPQAVNLWAGTAWRGISAGPAADVVAGLAAG
jgi:nitronate monooxygenase